MNAIAIPQSPDDSFIFKPFPNPTIPRRVHPDTISYAIQNLGVDLPPDIRLTPAELIPYVEDRLDEVDTELNTKIHAQNLAQNARDLVQTYNLQGELTQLLNDLYAAAERDQKIEQALSSQPTGDHPLKPGRLPAQPAPPSQPGAAASPSKSAIPDPQTDSTAVPDPQSEISEPQPTIPPALLAACSRLGVPVPAHPAPTTKTLLPVLERRVLEHAGHPALECENPDSPVFLEEKQIHLDLLQLLADLQTIALTPVGAAIASATSKSDPLTLAQPTGDHPLKPGRLPAQISPLPEPESGSAPSTPLAPTIPFLVPNPNLNLNLNLNPISPVTAPNSQPEIQNPQSITSPLQSTESTPPPVALPPLTPPQQQILATLQNPPRPLSPLDHLSSERQAALYELLLANPYPDVLAVIQLPAPHGWGLHTSQSALSRFVQRYPLKQHRDEAEAFAAANNRLPDHPELTNAQILAETDRLLNLRLLRLSRSRNASTRELCDLYQIKHRQKQIDLAERRLEYQFPLPPPQS